MLPGLRHTHFQPRSRRYLGGIPPTMTKEPEVGIGLVAVGGLLLMRIVV